MPKKKRKKKINSLYIHIPFCKSICPYCDFTKILKNNKFENDYIKQLENDLDKIIFSCNRFNTIYIGGGTPSVLELSNLEKILFKTDKLLKKNTEFTIECNIEDITENLLILLKKHFVNRLSIGIQSFKKETLSLLGRNIIVDYDEKIQLAKKYFDNINVDFIYGLPNETFEDIQNNLNHFLKLDIQHISIYSLIISPGTIFYNKKIEELDEDKGYKIYKTIIKTLNKNGFKQYEVSNFAKKGFQSKHNINYWCDNNYVGVGLGASGYIDNIRYTNSKNISEYINGSNKITKEDVDLEKEKEEFIMLNLRKSNGFLLSTYKKRFNEDFYLVYKEEVEELVKNHFAIINKRFKFTFKGSVIQDLLTIKFFK